MPNRHKIILSSNELQNANIRDEVIKNLKSEGFTDRKIIIYKKSLHKDISLNDSQRSLFSEKEIIDIRLQEKTVLKDDAEFLVSILKKENPDRSIVISSLNKKIKTTAWFKKVATSSNLFEEPTVYSNQIKDWIKNEAKKMDLILSDEGLNLIASRNEENLLSAFQELKFLKCLDRKDTGYEFVRDSSEYHVFSLVNNFLVNNISKSLEILEIMRLNKENEPGIITVIYQQLDRLEQLKQNPNFFLKGVPRDYTMKLKIKAKKYLPYKSKV